MRREVREARIELVAIGACIEPSRATQTGFFEPVAAASRAKTGSRSSHAVSIDTDHVEARI